MSSVSVYIPVYNGYKYIKKCLTALFGQGYDFCDVIIVDDCSTDELQQWAAEQTEFDITYVRLNERVGIAAARNEAIRRCRGDLIVSVDVDCVAHDGWLCTLMGVLTDPAIAGAGGQLVETVCRTIPDAWRGMYLRQTQGTKIREVHFLPGCNTVFRQEALSAIEGYDEAYCFHHEDTNLGMRMSTAGLRVWYVPEAVVEHIKRDTMYSVMRSCWGFRHVVVISSLPFLCGDIMHEFLRSIRLFAGDMVCGRLAFCFSIDLAYFFYQSFFSIQSYRYKHNHF